MTFVRKWLDSDAFLTFMKAFVIYNDNIVAWDRGPAGANDGYAIQSADGGDTWTTLFSALGATYGAFNTYDASAMVVLNGSLFISMARSDAVSPKVIEWDGVGITAHLPHPTAGGLDNYFTIDMVSWSRKLWIVTDVTTGAADRRKVYYYDPFTAAWTGIADYDGATYLDYNKGDGASPGIFNKHRTTRLFVFNNELYLVATRWSSTASTWAWEVWRLDSEDFDNFTLVYDSDAIADGYALSAILLHDSTVYLVGNELDTGGDAFETAKLYTSTDMENWTEETGAAIFEDEFDDAARDPAWTDEANNGTIVEAGDLLTIAVANGVNGDFWGAVKNAPITTMTPGDDEIMVVTKLNSYTVNDETRAGIYITNQVDGNNGIHFGRVKSTVPQNGIAVIDMGVGDLFYVGLITLPIWLRVRISGSGVGSVMKFDYSTDGAAWVHAYTHTNETWSLVGLAAWNWAGFNAISAPFEFFHVIEGDLSMVGYPYGETVFNDLIYLNCADVDPVATNYYTWIRYWDSTNEVFALSQEITTNPNIRGGGLQVFETDDLFAGKYMEIYEEETEPAVTRQLRRKHRCLPLLEMTWLDKLGVELVKHYTFIDAPASARVYEGRIKSMSTLTRALDDRTGLYKVADMEVVFVNNDKEFSKLLTTYILKNQEAKLYHVWADELETSRTHIISFFVDDCWLEGVEFHVRLKDVTQRYFSKKVPEDICTEADFADIHPDHAGRYMPEILGLASLGTTFEHPGAVEAVYVDTTGPPYRCLASAGLITIPTDEVWIGDVQKIEGAGNDYTVVQAGGRTYIHFNAGQDPGDDKISFNAEGYAFGPWNSVNGYIQNPAYIILYYMQYMMSTDVTLLDIASFDTLATYFEDIGEEESGKLILQGSRDAMEVLRELLFSFGIKGYVAKGGEFRVERKDIHNYEIATTEEHLFDQTDLMDSPRRLWNLPQMINTIKVQFNYFPWQNIFAGADSDFKDNLIDEVMEDDNKMRRKIWEL